MGDGSLKDVDIDASGIHFGILLSVLLILSMAIEGFLHFIEHVSSSISLRRFFNRTIFSLSMSSIIHILYSIFYSLI